MISDFMRCGVALVRALVLFPFYFLLFTLFILWPWRLGAPFFLVRHLAVVKIAPQAAALRLIQLRLQVRIDLLLDMGEGGRPRLTAGRLRGWFATPIRRTIPQCATLTRRESERLGESGFLRKLTLFLDSLVDSYKYGNGTVTRHWFDQERRGSAGFHIPNHYHKWCSCYLLNHRLNPHLRREQRHHHKLDLFELCRTNGWPTVSVHASFVSGRMSECDPIKGAPLISKPAASTEGRGHFERWWPEPDSSGSSLRYTAEDGTPATVQEVFDHVAGRSSEEPYLLQELIYSHKDIRDLSGGNTLCTLRLPTCRFPDGRVELLPLGLFRMPTQKDSVFDNMAQGGVAYRVNTHEGCLEAGSIYGSYDTFTAHPTTSKEIVGFSLPYWRETVDLCKTVHGVGFSSYPTVGWDIALTDRGPVLLESNIQWATEHGIPNEGFLGKTAYVDCILSYIRQLWPGNCPADARIPMATANVRVQG